MMMIVLACFCYSQSKSAVHTELLASHYFKATRQLSYRICVVFGNIHVHGRILCIIHFILHIPVVLVNQWLSLCLPLHSACFTFSISVALKVLFVYLCINSAVEGKCWDMPYCSITPCNTYAQTMYRRTLWNTSRNEDYTLTSAEFSWPC